MKAFQENERVRRAIVAVRIYGRDLGTMAEVRDALARRRAARVPASEAFKAKARNWCDFQLRVWGRIEEPFRIG